MFRTVNVNEISKDVQIRKRSDLRNEVWDILMSKRDQQEVTSEMGGKPAECVILDAKWGKRINEQEEQFSYTFDLKCVGNLKSLFQKKLYQSFFFFSQKLLMVEKLPAARWRHLSRSACGAMSSHFLTWQCSLQWHFQHHLEDQEIQSGWQHQRWAWSDLSRQVLIQEIRENGGRWALIPRCYREFFWRLTADLQICKLFKLWSMWIWKKTEKRYWG